MTDLETVLDKATDVLGSRERALDWVEKQSGTLGASPKQMTATPEGAKVVLLHLIAISQHSHQ